MRPTLFRIAPVAALVFMVVALAACGSRGEGQGQARNGEVVLYSSADTDYIKLVADAFEKQSGIHVKWVGDTEATKTTGLVQRLRAEMDRPRADVWWSSEPFGTIRLAREGVLLPYRSDAAEKSIDGGWPAGLRGTDGTWYGFAQRARVFVYNTEKVKPEDVPHTLADLTDPKFKGRVGMARPEFGTTGGHMAAIAQLQGLDTLRLWLTRLEDNGLRVYQGNSNVMRAVATGEIHVGLADTDDVWAGLKRGYPINLAYERNDIAANPQASFRPPPATLEIGFGPLVLPNTVALVKGGPNPANAKTLMDFLLSEKVERLLAESDSHNIPVHPALAADPALARYVVKDPMKINLEQAAEIMPDAMKACDEVLR